MNHTPIATPSDKKAPVIIAIHLGFGWVPIVNGSLQFVPAGRIDSLPKGLADDAEVWFSCVDADGKDKMIQGRASAIQAFKMRVIDK